MSYEFNPSDVYGLTRMLGAEYHERGSELEYKICPYCHGGDNHDKYTFSINLESGAYKCLRSTCGEQGHFVELARDFGYRLEGLYDEPKKKYRTFPKADIVTRDEAVEYMKTRGISEEVTKRYHLTVRKDARNVLVFPFQDENGDLRFIKYRKTDFVKGRDKNKEWSETNTEPILFGMAQCDYSCDTAILTEGQIDSLSVAEAGFQNALSVPTGAQGFKWISTCYDWLVSHFKRIIVFGDYERGEITLLNQMLLRVPIPIYHVRPQDYLGEKDANDILRKYGTKAIKTAIDNAVRAVTPHIKPLSDVRDIDLETLPKIYTGIETLDKVIGGLFYKQVILLSGKRGEGKSTFASMVCANALNQGIGVFVYSGELPDYHFKNWLNKQISGPQHLVYYLDKYGNEKTRISEQTANLLDDWYRDRAYIYDNTAVNDDELSDVINAAEMAIKRYGVKFLLIDNLMTAMDCKPSDDLYRAQSDFVKRLKDITNRYEVTTLLIAHPKKSSGTFDNDSVSGSSDITNRVDVVMNYQRAPKECDYQSVLTLTKNRLTGELITEKNAIHLYYSDATKRIVENPNVPKEFNCFITQSQADDDFPEDFL